MVEGPWPKVAEEEPLPRLEVVVVDLGVLLLSPLPKVGPSAFPCVARMCSAVSMSRWVLSSSAQFPALRASKTSQSFGKSLKWCWNGLVYGENGFGPLARRNGFIAPKRLRNGLSSLILRRCGWAALVSWGCVGESD